MTAHDTKINIRQASKDLPDLYEKLLREDRNRDGNLSPDDLIPIYGKTAVAEFFPEIQKALQHGDENRFALLKWDMIFAREQKVNALFRPAIESMKSLGLVVDGDSLDFSKILEASREAAKKLFSGAWAEILSSEFDFTEQQAALLQNGATCFDEGLTQYAPTKNLASVLLLSAFAYCYPRPNFENGQREYAAIQKGEAYPQREVASLEKEFGIDIKSSYSFTANEIGILQRALSRIRSLRPHDFSKIKKLNFKDHPEERLQASALGFEEEGILVYSRFSPSDPLPGLPDSKLPYSADWRQIHATGSHEENLFNTLLHELGHGVRGRGATGPISDVEYTKLFEEIPGIPVWIELFAEDYRIFYSSGGKRVMRQMLSGWEVPHYEERLRLFQQREGKPLAQNWQERLFNMDFGPFPQF